MVSWENGSEENPSNSFYARHTPTARNAKKKQGTTNRDYIREELNGFSFFIAKEELMSNQKYSMKEDVNVEEQKTVLTIKETAKERWLRQ